jgi:G3E family GTPase
LFCKNATGELIEQITAIASKGTFDYMVIEGSGVSEPFELSQMFTVCEDNHDHDAEHGKTSLYKYARLDTCVTVIDGAGFLDALDTIKVGATKSSCAQLMVEQVEYAHVVVLNKTDLINKSQLAEIYSQVALLNPKAKLLSSRNSKIDVMEILDTKLHHENSFTISSLAESIGVNAQDDKSCCAESLSKGKAPCCKSTRTFTSDKSTVVLGSKGQQTSTKHGARFGITSFLFKARRPFHPDRLHEDFLEKYFVFIEKEEDDDDEDENMEQKEAKVAPVEDDDVFVQRQQEAKKQQTKREFAFGNILRSKGFFWNANTHDMMNFWGHAGNMVTIETPGCWQVLNAQAWDRKDPMYEMFRKDYMAPYGDRRQELIFIGQSLDHEAIQKCLDSCLLTDEEMAMGIDGWKATMGDIFLDELGCQDEDGDDEDGDSDSSEDAVKTTAMEMD